MAVGRTLLQPPQPPSLPQQQGVPVHTLPQGATLHRLPLPPSPAPTHHSRAQQVLTTLSKAMQHTGHRVVTPTGKDLGVGHMAHSRRRLQGMVDRRLAVLMLLQRQRLPVVPCMGPKQGMGLTLPLQPREPIAQLVPPKQGMARLVLPKQGMAQLHLPRQGTVHQATARQPMAQLVLPRQGMAQLHLPQQGMAQAPGLRRQHGQGMAQAHQRRQGMGPQALQLLGMGPPLQPRQATAQPLLPKPAMELSQPQPRGVHMWPPAILLLQHMVATLAAPHQQGMAQGMAPKQQQQLLLLLPLGGMGHRGRTLKPAQGTVAGVAMLKLARHRAVMEGSPMDSPLGVRLLLREASLRMVVRGPCMAQGGLGAPLNRFVQPSHCRSLLSFTVCNVAVCCRLQCRLGAFPVSESMHPLVGFGQHHPA